MSRHHIVAVLVDLAHDLAEGRGVLRRKQARVVRRFSFAHLPAQAAAQFAPEGAEHPFDLYVGRPRREVQRFFAAGSGQAAVQLDRVAIDRHFQLFTPVAAGFVAEGQSIGDAQPFVWRFADHRHRFFCLVGLQCQAQAFEIDQ